MHLLEARAIWQQVHRKQVQTPDLLQDGTPVFLLQEPSCSTLVFQFCQSTKFSSLQDLQ